MAAIAFSPETFCLCPSGVLSLPDKRCNAIAHLPRRDAASFIALLATFTDAMRAYATVELIGASLQGEFVTTAAI